MTTTMTKEELLKQAGRFGTDDGLTVTFTAENLLAFLNTLGVAPAEVTSRPVTYYGRRWCTGDNAWTDWMPMDEASYKRNMLDRSFQLRILGANEPAPAND